MLSKQRSLLPIYASEHWTLLSIDVADGAVTEARYRDSLTIVSEPCREKAAEVLKWLSDTVELIQRQSYTFQKVGSALCVFSASSG